MQAMDKIRFLSLTEPSVLGEGEAAKLDIKARVYAEMRLHKAGRGCQSRDFSAVCRIGRSHFAAQPLRRAL